MSNIISIDIQNQISICGSIFGEKKYLNASITLWLSFRCTDHKIVKKVAYRLLSSPYSVLYKKGNNVDYRNMRSNLI